MNILSTIKKHGYTISSLAKKMGVAQSTLSINIKKNNPTIGSLHRMADAMNINYLEFFSDEMNCLGHDKDSLSTISSKFSDVIIVQGKRYGLVPLDD